MKEHGLSRRLSVDLIPIAMMAICLSSITACNSPGSRNEASPATQIFDEHSNGKELVATALDRAKSEDKLVILLFGANWCPYCRKLHHDLQNDTELKDLVESSFVVVPIDVGTSYRNRNTALIDRYDASVFTDGTPALVVIDQNGRRLAPTSSNPWSVKSSLTPNQLRQFLGTAMR